MDSRLAGATDDYLRLRHRAKEAHAASAEEQRQCSEAQRKVTFVFATAFFLLSICMRAHRWITVAVEGTGLFVVSDLCRCSIIS